jgi:hypothetical protein
MRQWEKPWFQLEEAELMLPKLGRCFTHQSGLKATTRKLESFTPVVVVASQSK